MSPFSEQCPIHRPSRACARGLFAYCCRAAHPARDRRKRRKWIMADHVYKLIELVGTSPQSVTDAVQNAITRASATIRNIRWFEVIQVRGEVAGPLSGDAQGRLYARGGVKAGI